MIRRNVTIKIETIKQLVLHPLLLPHHLDVLLHPRLALGHRPTVRSSGVFQQNRPKAEVHGYVFKSTIASDSAPAYQSHCSALIPLLRITAAQLLSSVSTTRRS